MRKFLQATAVAILCGMTFVSADAAVIGTADNASSYPFGSPMGGYYFQQIYDAASFDGAMSISQLTFYNSVLPGGTPRSGDFQIYLSTSNADIASFDTTLSQPWFDPAFTLVFSGALPALADGRLDLLLGTAFNYNPLDGNLLLTVREFTLAGSSDLFLDVDTRSGLTNSRFTAYPYNWNQGLVTGFNDVATTPAPEPATWALLLAGVGSSVVTMRRRKSKSA